MADSVRSRWSKGIPGKKDSPGKKGYPGKKQKRQKDKRRLWYYVAEILVIGTVVVAAFFFPQLIFHVEDDILCSDITLGQRESMDVESLSTAYEKALVKRMHNFAHGLSENKRYYVTSQDLAVNDELEDYLYSDIGLYQGIIQELVYGDLIPVQIWDDYSVVLWKQYVVYSDNFEEGVNFILWYIEMQEDSGGVFKLLADAEDGTIYGIRTEGGFLPGNKYSYKEYMEIIQYGQGAVDAWLYYASYYDAMSKDMEDVLFWAEKMGVEPDEVDNNGNYETKYSHAEAELLIQDSFNYQNESEGKVCFRIPYGDAALDVVMFVEEQETAKMYIYPNIIVGIRQIYEMIPEFA